MKAISLIALLGLLGCKNPEIVQLSPGVYMLSRADRGGVFGNSAKMKADVIREANEFAAKQGKVAIPVSTQETPMYIGHFATIDYQFRLVDKDSLEAKSPTVLGPTPTISIQKMESKDVTPAKRDIYADLEKLDELRKKGILTEEEFQAQKKKLLEAK